MGKIPGNCFMSKAFNLLECAIRNLLQNPRKHGLYDTAFTLMDMPHCAHMPRFASNRIRACKATTVAE